MRAVAAGGLYVSVMFALGFVLGPIRVLLVEPSLGPVRAILLEAPFLLLGMLLAAPRAMRWADMPDSLGNRLVMGLTAAAWLMLFEMLGSALLRGVPPGELLRQQATPHGLIGLALVGVLGLAPLVVRRRAHDRASAAG